MAPRSSVDSARSAPCVHAFEDSDGFGRELAAGLKARFAPVQVHRFPDGESLVRVDSAPDRRAILVRSLFDPNPKIVETLLAADALRRAGVRRTIFVAPYMPYMRQDRVFAPGEPISQRVIGGCLGRAFEQVLTIAPHLHRVRRLAEVFPCGARSLSAAPAIAEYLRAAGGADLVVGPDEESRALVRAVARAAGARFIVATKQRLGDRRVRITLPTLPRAADAVVLDDIASSGVTLAAAVRALRERGVRRVIAIVVHALFAPGAIARICAAGARKVISCDTIPHRTNAIKTAPIVAAALARRAS